MDDQQPDPPPKPRVRRAAPTIDLRATVISEKPAASEQAEARRPAENNDVPKRAPASFDWRIAGVAAGLGAAAAALVGIAAFALLTGSPFAVAPKNSAESAKLAAKTATPDNSARSVMQPAPSQLPADTARLEALEKNIAALKAELQTARQDPATPPATVTDKPVVPDMSAIEERLAKIEQSTASPPAAKPEPAPVVADDPRLKRLAAVSALDAAARRGDALAEPLAAVKLVEAADASSLKPLEAYAAQGIPNVQTLADELRALIPRIASLQKAADASASMTERLQASAMNLVRIQRTDLKGDDDVSRAGRAAVATQRGETETARAEIAAMTAQARALLQPWLDKLAARDAALAASRQLTSDATAALSKPASQ